MAGLSQCSHWPRAHRRDGATRGVRAQRRGSPGGAQHGGQTLAHAMKVPALCSGACVIETDGGVPVKAGAARVRRGSEHPVGWLDGPRRWWSQQPGAWKWRWRQRGSKWTGPQPPLREEQQFSSPKAAGARQCETDFVIIQRNLNARAWTGWGQNEVPGHMVTGWG